jgi:hypothetical protein
MSVEEWNYRPLFELGVYNEESPTVKVLEDIEITSGELATLCATLFETVSRTLDDSKQIAFEKEFNETLSNLLEERCNYDTVVEYLDDE